MTPDTIQQLLENDPVVVTGMGAVSSNASSAGALWERVIEAGAMRTGSVPMKISPMKFPPVLLGGTT